MSEVRRTELPTIPPQQMRWRMSRECDKGNHSGCSPTSLLTGFDERPGGTHYICPCSCHGLIGTNSPEVRRARGAM